MFKHACLDVIPFTASSVLPPSPCVCWPFQSCTKEERSVDPVARPFRAVSSAERFCLGLILTLRSLTLYIYGAPILDVSRSHTTTQHSR